MRARIVVTLKTAVLDPQGKAIEGALGSLGVEGVRSVRQGKVFDIELDGTDRTAGEAALKRAAERLLANPVIETFRIELAEDGEADRPELAAATPPPADLPEAAFVSAPDMPQAAADAPTSVDPEAATESAAASAAMPTEGHP